MNPLAQPATILGGNPAIDQYQAYVNKVQGDIERKRQREALKQAQVDEALLPPDIDAKGAFQYEVNEITGLLNDYSKTKADLATLGHDITTPEYKNKFYQIESGIKEKVIKSTQHQKLYEEAVKTIATNPEDIDQEASQKRLSEFVTAANQGVEQAHQYLMNNGGSLLVEKPFDIYKFAQDNAGKFKTETIETDPTRKGGLYVTETTEDWSPTTKQRFGELMMGKPAAARQIDFEYQALSPDKKAEYEQIAITNNQPAGAAISFYAADRYGSPYVQKKTTNDFQKVATGGSGSGTKTDAPKSNTLVDAFKGAYELNPNYVKKDAQGYYTLDMVGVPIGNFDLQIPAQYNEAGQMVKVAETKYGQPELIESMKYNPDDKKWYYRSNRTANQGLGKTVGGTTNMLPLDKAGFKNLMTKVAINTGEYADDSEISKYLSSTGQLAADNSLNWQAGGSSPEKDVFFEGTTYSVPKTAIDKSKGYPVATLPDGRKVKWTGTEWVAEETEVKDKGEDLRKKYNY